MKTGVARGSSVRDAEPEFMADIRRDSVKAPGEVFLKAGEASHTCLLGTIQSDPQFKPGLVPELSTIRGVSWQGEVRRDLLSVSTRNSVGAIMALFKVSEDAAQEIEAKARTKAQENVVEEREEQQDVADVLKDFQSRSHEFIKDRLSRLDGAQMQPR